MLSTMWTGEWWKNPNFHLKILVWKMSNGFSHKSYVSSLKRKALTTLTHLNEWKFCVWNKFIHQIIPKWFQFFNHPLSVLQSLGSFISPVSKVWGSHQAFTLALIELSGLKLRKVVGRLCEVFALSRSDLFVIGDKVLYLLKNEQHLKVAKACIYSPGTSPLLKANPWICDKTLERNKPCLSICF